MDHIKDLFHLVKNQLDDRLKELEKQKKKSSTKTSVDNDAQPLLNDEISEPSSSATSFSSSVPSSALSLARNNKKPSQHFQPAASATAEGKKRRYIYAPSTIEILEASSSPLSISLYSSMQLPRGCLAEHDGCDEEELIARAKRCQEILRLSQQVKDSEAAKAKTKKEDTAMTDKKERDNT